MNGKAHASGDRMIDRGHDENSHNGNNNKTEAHNDVQLRPHVSAKLFHKADKPKKHNGNGKLVSGHKADSQWEHSRWLSVFV